MAYKSRQNTHVMLFTRFRVSVGVMLTHCLHGAMLVALACIVLRRYGRLSPPPPPLMPEWQGPQPKEHWQGAVLLNAWQGPQPQEDWQGAIRIRVQSGLHPTDGVSVCVFGMGGMI